MPQHPSKKRAKKIVKKGDFFEEHIFEEKNETFIGSWIKSGHEVFFNQSAKQLLDCNACLDDRQKRLLNRKPKQDLRSYQVEGRTEKDQYWWWEYGACSNKNYWGPYTRTLTFQRQNKRMRLAHYKMLNGSKNSPERIDQLYFNICEVTGGVYSGIACPVGLGGLFWPLFKNLKCKQKMHIYIEMASKKVLPHNVVCLEQKDWPPFYKNNPSYIYPHTIEFRIFQEDSSTKQSGIPVSIKHLEENGGPEVARVYGFMYPGGAGMRLEHYKFLDGPKPRDRMETPEMPSWWPGGGKFCGFLRDYQCGWAGPIVSFWRRESVEKFS